MTQTLQKEHDTHSAHSPDTESRQQFLTFSVDKEEYGVDLLKIREIKGWTETTRIPNSPECMRGVINLRGSVIPIFDLKGRFGLENSKPSATHVVIIIAVGNRLVGMLVDAVSDIVDVAESDIKPAPKMDTKIDDSFVQGLISRNYSMVVLLNVDTLFDVSALHFGHDSQDTKQT